ncbi:MAG: glycoside hydrolase family 31 protein [Chloroflexota bacterium]|nr:glycoside hydrolase family 31 protein [Chloroflexota bacterium]
MHTLSLFLRGIKDLGLATVWDSAIHQIRQRRYQARFARSVKTKLRSPDPLAVSGPLCPGHIVSHLHQDQTVTITCANGSYALTVLAPDLIRVHLQPTSSAQPPVSGSYSIAKPDGDWPPCDFYTVETGTDVEIRTSRLVCRVAKTSGRLTFLDLDGNIINEDESGAGYHSAGPVICHKRIQPDEHFYGLGERTFGLDRRGHRYGMWNTDPQTYQLAQDPIHMCMPVLLGLHSQGRQGYGIFFDNTFRGQFDLGVTDPAVASFGAEGGELCYYFIYGPALTTVGERYTELTGRMRLPPRWMLGYHQCRWSYYPEPRVRKLATDFRQVHHVPCDCIHLDIHYMEGYRCFTWDSERFPDPAGLIADLHEQGFKVIVIIDPGIKADHNYWVCKSGLEQDVFCKYPDDETLFEGPVWPGGCYFPDFTNPRVRAWWGNLYKALTDVGVDGFWNDMNEPVVFGPLGTTFPDFVRHDLEGSDGDHVEAHNVYGMQMARATVEGLTRLRPDERPVCITRSGWAGVQRYAMGWTGDNESNWGSMWLTMPMLMNLGLCGLAHTGPDIGGFSGFATGELFTRWLQMGIFLPFLRAHTHIHSPDQEPWSWGEPYLSIVRRFIELRYQLLPYLYTTFWQCAQTGLPIVRPLLLVFQEDAATHALDDQFLCGDAFLVAPVIEEGATCRSVYLPVGVWYDFWTEESFDGPARVEVEAPLERLPLFVRSGSVVPTGPPMQYVGERSVKALTLHVYPGDGEGQLYEDDGRTQAFQDGNYRLTRFALSTEGTPPLRLDLHCQIEGRYEPGGRGFEVIIHGVDELPRTATTDGQPIERCELDSSGHAVCLHVGLFEHLSVEWA